MAERGSENSRAMWIGAVVGIVALGALGWWVYREDELPAPATVASTNPVAADPSAVEPEAEPEPPPPAFPVPDAQPGAAPLPDLDGSDDNFLAALGDVTGKGPIETFLLPTRIIQRLVIFIDNLDRPPLPLRFWPVQHTPGLFVTNNASSTLSIDARNGARYENAVAALEALDAQKVSAIYFRFYPLFQQAYRQVGYPDRQFNDRLVEIIDHLLEAPEITTPIELVRPKVVYEFADTELEKLSSGQKTMIRIGPTNESRVKAKLRQFRAALTAERARPAAKG